MKRTIVTFAVATGIIAAGAVQTHVHEKERLRTVAAKEVQSRHSRSARELATISRLKLPVQNSAVSMK